MTKKIIEITEIEFNKQYENALEPNEKNEYVNFPQELFLLKTNHKTIKYIAIDNTDLNAWVEEFKTKEKAIKWLINYEYEE